jgi:hypothetical protein
MKLATLLKKHLDEGAHGTATKMARAIGTDRQRLYEWASGKVIPRKAMGQTIVEYLRSLKQQAPQKQLDKADKSA